MAREQIIIKLEDDYGDTHTYSIVHLKSRVGWAVLCKLVGLIGGAAGRSMGSITPANVAEQVSELSGVLDSSLDGGGVAVAIEKVSDKLLTDDRLLRDLFGGVARDGVALKSEEAFDEAYAGNYGELFAAVKTVLVVNYGPFFRRVLGELERSGALAKLKAKAKAATSSRGSETAA